MSFPYLIQGGNIVIVIDNVTHTITKTHIGYAQVLDAIKARDWDKVRDVIEPKKVLQNFSKGNLTIVDSVLHWRGKELHSTLATKMVDMLEEGFDITPFVNFMHNLMENPSNRSVQQCYTFIEKSKLPITEDGHFLAFKNITSDWLDCYTKSIDNRPGQVVEMDRNLVNDDPDCTCSHGLHFCSLEYLPYYPGDRTIIVKVNPRDIVSIPRDHNSTKARCCRYEVIGELGVRPEEAFEKTVEKDPSRVCKDQGDEYYNNGNWPVE